MTISLSAVQKKKILLSVEGVLQKSLGKILDEMIDTEIEENGLTKSEAEKSVVRRMTAGSTARSVVTRACVPVAIKHYKPELTKALASAGLIGGVGAAALESESVHDLLVELFESLLG